MNVFLALVALFVPQTAEEIRARAKELQPLLTEIRKLELKQDIKIGVYTKEELRDYIMKEFEREITDEEISRYAKAYAAYGLIPADLDLKKTYIDLYSGAIAGFYDPQSKELKLITADPEKMTDEEKERRRQEEEMEKQLGIKQADVTLIHEMTHGAQDQYYDLQTVGTAEEDNDDQVYALKCVSEGDASVVMWKYGFGDRYDRMKRLLATMMAGGDSLPSETQKVPNFLRETLAFPYSNGFMFVDKVLGAAKGDYTATSKRCYTDPPCSTEQILHPEKYLTDRDDPTWIDLPDVSDTLGKGWTRIFRNVWGELVVRIMLTDLKATTARASKGVAAGWDGDKSEAYLGPDGRVVAIWLSTWDTEDDAREFFAAYEKAILAKHEGLEAGSGDRRVYAGAHLLEIRGADVLAIENAPDGVEALAGRVWNESRRSQMTQIMRLPFLWECKNHAKERKYKKDACRECKKDMTPIDRGLKPIPGIF